MTADLNLAAFVIAAVVVLILPGPGVLYVVTRSLAQGQRAGLASVLGLSLGTLVHVLAAVAGLSAILMASATAFGIVKLLGAAYLVYLGLRALLSRKPANVVEQDGADTASRIFTDGIVVSVLNPKLAMFFLAFLPQFVDPAGGPVGQQVLLLGLLYVALALVTDGSYALLASRLRGWFRRHKTPGPLPRFASGAVYVGLGITTALAERR